MKRAFDVLLAIVLLWILALPMLFVALAMRTTQGRGILFRQQRMGRHGVPFDILKFRTMRPPRPGDGRITQGESDARISPFGAILRRYRIDEWPQLWNVLRGDMSMVGPRPEVPEYVDMHHANWQAALSVRPGITGPDALAFKDEGERLANAKDADSCYRDEILPEKLAMQARYAQERTLAGDIRLLFRTLGALRG